jgi:hypothetical protein
VSDYFAPTGLPYLSVSQVETALGEEGCEFKWELRYLHKIKQPRDGSADVGDRAHLIAGEYVDHGTQPDLNETMTRWHKRKETDITYHPGAMFAVVIPFLPSCKIKSEGRFKFSTDIHGKPVWWQGAKDFEWQDADGLWHVGDLKTTVSWSYMKTEKVLRKDWQANLYAYNVMKREGVQRVALDWFTTISDPEKPRECRATRIVVLWPEVLAVVTEIEKKGHCLTFSLPTARRFA